MRDWKPLLLWLPVAVLLLCAGSCTDADPDLPAAPSFTPPPVRTDPPLPPPIDRFPAGFVYRDPQGARRFKIAQGPVTAGETAVAPRLADPVFLPLGINYAWPSIPAGALEFRSTLPTLRQNGVNLVRVWQSTWGFDLGGWNADGRLDGPGLDALDQVFREAEKCGVSILLVYDNHFDVLNNQNLHGLFKASGLPGGVCGTILDYFQAPAARAVHAARLKALLARYGNSAAFFGLEFFNELDLALPVGLFNETNTAALEQWARFMADTVQAERRAGNLAAWHPIGISTVGTRTLNCFADTRFDWVSVHLYIPEGLMLLRKEQMNETQLAAQVSLYYDFQPSNRPIPTNRQLPHRPWIMEYGFAAPGHRAPRNDHDPAGHHLRHALWATLAAGGEGAPMPWWWDNYILPKKLYALYRPLAAATAGLPWDELPVRMVSDRAAATVPAFAAGESWHYRLYATVWSRAALIYLANEKAAWVAKPGTVWPAGHGRLRLGSYAAGRYAVEWIDPASGRAAAPNQIIDHAGGPLELDTPPFSDDLAAVLHAVP